MSSCPELGRFSVSLSVESLSESRRFYETLGFEQVHGVPDDGWIILQRGEAVVGLFQGMFEGNLLTFNPADARGIERHLREAGYEIEKPTEGDSGPTSFAMRDPDGNIVLVDQHTP